ncbi:hypothetical protein [Paenibacillus puerhi]|uniref:hypothetical protein n=1 Tax=Paenibacillus puerhi TaxID=2692622 RepID=UPI001356D015|nr:hypothetical protein [Paenibacillus puerhi]
MLVVYWSPVPGQAGTTSNLIAAATMIALDHQVKVLVMQTHGALTMLENAYSRLRPNDRIHGHLGGLEGVKRLVECDLLTPIGLRDHAESIVKDRLDLLAGTETTANEDWSDAIPPIVTAAKQYYDVVFVDVPAGGANPATDTLLRLADQIVVNLNQNVFLRQTAYDSAGWPEALANRKLLYNIGSFDRKSKYSLDRLVKAYGLSRNHTGIVPRNTKFMDALLDQNILDFLLRCMAQKSGFLEYNEEADWLRHVRLFNKRLLKVLDLSPAAGGSIVDA